MKATRKNPLSYAIGAILAGMAVVPMTASAAAVNVTTAGGGFVVNNDGADALAYPIYSTVNGVTSAFSLTNTSDRSIAVKVRFREQQRSMDVWDAIVFLSPEDKWDFTVSASADPDIPQVNGVGGDTTCTTVPSFPSLFRDTPFNAAGKADGRWTVGHVEVIGMMDLENAFLPDAPFNIPLNDLVEGRECDALRTIFTNPQEVALINFGAQDGNRTAGEVDNVLIGRYVIGIDGGGVEAGDVPVALANTFNVALPFAQSASASLAACRTAANPNVASPCISTYAWDRFQEDHPHLGDIFNSAYQNIDAATAAGRLQGDWSSNPANFVGTDWIISFFSKYVYTNFVGGAWLDILPVNKTSLTVAAATPLAGLTNPFNTAATAAGVAAACLGLDMWGYDADENYGQGGVSPNPQRQICHEVNVLGLAADAADARPSLIQQNSGVFQRQVFEFPELADLGATRGWADLALLWPGATANPAIAARSAAVAAGLFMTRSEPSLPEANNASLVPLAHRP